MSIPRPSKQILKKASELFGLSQSLNFVRYVENAVFEDTQQGRFLRLTRPDRRPITEITAELHWLDYLYKNGAPVVEPLLSKNKNLIESITHEQEAFSAVVFRRAQGEMIINYSEHDLSFFKDWGKTLGLLHKLTKFYKIERSESFLPRPQWHDESCYVNALSAAQDDGSAIYHYLTEFIDFLKNKNKTLDNFGLIHSDLHSGNFFVDKAGGFEVFDFDDSQYNFFMYDIGTILHAIRANFFKHNKTCDDQPLTEAFWTGYHLENRLPGGEIELSEGFFKFRAALHYYWCKSRESGFEDDIKKALQPALQFNLAQFK